MLLSEFVIFFSPQFTGMSVTSGVDQMVALHTSSQDDVLLCLQRGELCPNQDRVGELVGTLVDHFTRSVHKQMNLVNCVLWLLSVLSVAVSMRCESFSEVRYFDLGPWSRKPHHKDKFDTVAAPHL